MTLASEITISKLLTYSNQLSIPSSVTLLSSSNAASVGSAAVVITSLNSIGWFYQTNMQSIFDSSAIFSASSGIISTPWSGSANTWGTNDMLMSSSMTFGAFLGVADSAGSFYQLPETRNSEQISILNPESDQSITLVDWNFFLLPIQPTVIATTSRDATRYQKSYSFGRKQPVRIRVFR